MWRGPRRPVFAGYNQSAVIKDGAEFKNKREERRDRSRKYEEVRSSKKYAKKPPSLAKRMIHKLFCSS